jgi:hypothetical protein
MKLWENFSGSNLRELLNKALHAEELVYPLRLVDVKLRNLELKDLGTQLHYWQMIQIHELLNHFYLLPDRYDHVLWYQYLAAYLLLPKMEELIEINRLPWNTEVKVENRMLIEEAIKMSLNLLSSPILVNKIVEQSSEESIVSTLKDEINAALSRKELSYPINLLEVNLRGLRTKVQYWALMEIHEILKHARVLPANYSQNLWYRYVAAYIIINHIGVEKVLDINKNDWSDEMRIENEDLIGRFDIDNPL